LTLVVLLAVVGFFLDRAFIDAARRDEQARLNDVGLMLLTQLTSDEHDRPVAPQGWLTNVTTPAGSVFVDVVLDEKPGWHLTSANAPMGLWILPDPPSLEGQGPVLVNTPDGAYFRLTQKLQWVTRSGTHPIRFQVAESALALQMRVADYRRTLLWSLLAFAIGIVGLQWVLLRWSLRPIERLTLQVRAVGEGEQRKVEDATLPIEVSPLASYINELIAHNDRQVTRYRHTCADVAHSLKTPLAVMRTQLEDAVFGGAPPGPTELLGQIERMDKVVTGQLTRAASGGRAANAKPIVAFAHAEGLAMGLEKLHAGRKIYCEFEVDEKALFYGSEGDLLDLLGNLLDNAFKWATGRVLLRIEAIPGKKHAGLLVGVEDDGPGVDPEQMDTVLSRGGRTDEKMDGHGLGLSTVQDLVRTYHAELDIGTSDELGGARFTVRFPG
jgi:two-component system sensor histidine kinase PhoQ